MIEVQLPFPPAALSGHAGGNWRRKAGLHQAHRRDAYFATLDALGRYKPQFPPKGDLLLRMRFFPPDRRSDRCNFANRMKPIIDGIAEALGVNDRRFLPQYDFYPPEPPGRVIISVVAAI